MMRIAAAGAALWLVGASSPQRPLHRHDATRLSMACVYAIEAYGPDAAALPRILDAAFDEVDRIDRLMSHYRTDSPLSRLNREGARHPVAVDPELYDFITDAMRYNRESGGAFDITVGPLMKAWGFFRGEGRMPSDAELAVARRYVGASHVMMNPASRTIAFDQPGVELDLGGIAKGYAVDRAVALLRQRGVTAALVSAGGSTIYALGAPPGRDGWDVAIQDPVDARQIARTVALRDRALSIAGSAEKSFESGGVTYSHLMDPRSGRPAQGLLSVAVLAPTGTAGDALDNAFFVMGPERSQAYLKTLPGTDAFFFLPSSTQTPRPAPDLEATPFAPRKYVAYRTPAKLKVDGKLDEAAWNAAAWSEAFVDIQGDAHPRPRFRTRAKMLWDDEYFYVSAEMEEPDVWGTLTERDAIIFRDNDFEIFIDPDGDTHAYGELEVNALGTPWDLLLIKPYRDGGPAIHAWDIAGLQLGIDVRGTLNRPGDRDDGWTVEIAMPWTILRETVRGQKPPQAGDRWRVNFSRVQWQVDVAAGRYVKRFKPGTKDPLPEDNWVWSPQGAVDMHMPERWGYVQFSGLRAGAGTEQFVDDPNERVKWALRRLYYRHKRLRAFPFDDIRVDGMEFRPVIQATASLYEITANGFNGTTVHINQDGRVWVTK